MKKLTLIVLVLVACGDDSTPTDGSFADGGSCRRDLDCDDGSFCNGDEACEGGRCVDGPPPMCDDGVACTLDRCDETLLRCVNEAPDADGDGHADADCGGDDCDDADPERYPGNPEVCDDDDHDEDCDPTTFGFRDGDGDGFPDARCCNETSCGNDCDDTLPSAHPGEAESCDGFDNDCDGTTDEGVTNTYYVDDDGDGFGAPGGATMMACFTPSGFAASNTDCDDGRGFVRPGGLERCDAEDPPLDEDCDGVANPPELCNCTIGDSRTCAAGGFGGVCASGTQTCGDAGWGACSIAPTPETCNGLDDDCNGLDDDGVTIACWEDADDDTFSLVGTPLSPQCPDPTRPLVGECPDGYTNREPVGAVMGIPNFECDDADPTIRPDQAETCNGIDDDCDVRIDEGVTLTCFRDGDRDGYAAAAASPTERCPAGGGCPVGFTERAPAAGADCDDGDAAISPIAGELCDGVDNDCDSATDEGLVRSCFDDGDDDGFAPVGAGMMVVCGDCPTGTTVRPPGAGTTDCDDGDAGASPAVPEICNDDDDDCDGSVDEGLTVMAYPDVDRDGFGDASASLQSFCATDAGYASTNTDCNDAEARVFPGQSNRFANPACPVGEVPCTLTTFVGNICNTGAVFNPLDVGMSCTIGGPSGSCDPNQIAYWDYDCDGRLRTSQPPAFCVGSTYDICESAPLGCGGSSGCGTVTRGLVWPTTNYGITVGAVPCGMYLPDATDCECGLSLRRCLITEDASVGEILSCG